MKAQHAKCPFHGSYVALPTPFRAGEIDYGALQDLIDDHAARKSDGLVIAGTTGEAATLREMERCGLIEMAVGAARRRFPVIAGVGTNCTRSTVEMARFAARAGVDGVLVVTPYYNKPTPRGLTLHYDQVADAVALPVVLYNVPSRTGVDLIPEVVRDLGARHKNVVAVKEALPSTERMKRLAGETDVAVLCGDDGAIADFVHLGAVGVIGVVSNVVPEKVAELVRCAASDGNSNRAAELVEFLAPLVRDLFIETNPVPVKAALAMLGMCREEVRAPLAPLEDAHRAQLAATLRFCGLL